MMIIGFCAEGLYRKTCKVLESGEVVLGTKSSLHRGDGGIERCRDGQNPGDRQDEMTFVTPSISN